jgi:hypothetical protein
MGASRGKNTRLAGQARVSQFLNADRAAADKAEAMRSMELKNTFENRY